MRANRSATRACVTAEPSTACVRAARPPARPEHDDGVVRGAGDPTLEVLRG